jgi:hypothetical protein
MGHYRNGPIISETWGMGRKEAVDHLFSLGADRLAKLKTDAGIDHLSARSVVSTEARIAPRQVIRSMTTRRTMAPASRLGPGSLARKATFLGMGPVGLTSAIAEQFLTSTLGFIRDYQDEERHLEIVRNGDEVSRRQTDAVWAEHLRLNAILNASHIPAGSRVEIPIYENGILVDYEIRHR